MADKRLRVVHIAKYYPPDPGGMEFVVRDLAREQARRGHEVLVLAHARQMPPGQTKDESGVKVKRFKVWATVGGYAPMAPELMRAIRQLGCDFKPDLIHLHCPNPAGVALWPLPCPLPLVLHWHADVVFPADRSPAGWQLTLWRKLERGLLKRAARIITTSPHYAPTSNVLADYLDKVRVVPLGLPSSSAADSAPVAGDATAWFRSRPAGRRLLAIGRLSHYKGYSFLLEALAGLAQVSLCLIGQGEEKELLEAQCARLGLNDRVLIAGQVSEDERESCLKLADLFCLPSLDRSEAFGLVLLEAMRAGKACLATRVPGSGMSHALGGGQAGVLVEPGDVEQLRMAIARLLADDHERKRLAEAGQARFLSYFTLPVIEARVEEIYEEILARYPL